MTDPQPNDDQSRELEEIVAYLDGELSPQESTQVERRLSSDAAYRRQLQTLQRAWAVLDELPAASVDDSFSKTTMEMVVDAARSEVQARTQALPIERRNRRLGTAAMVIVAALLGALVVRLRGDSPNRALVADLPVIQYVDIYSQFRASSREEIEFLRGLSRDIGTDGWPSAEPTADEFEQFRLVSDADSRGDWLESLAEDDRVSLRAKFNRFRALTDQQQDRLRYLHQEIDSAADGDDLQRTMLRYQQWLNGLPQSEQFELREMSPTERVLRVVQSVHRQREREFLDLSAEELREVLRAVQPRLEAIRAEAREAMPDDQRDEFDSAVGRGRIWRLGSRIPPERRMDVLRAVYESLPPEKRSQFEQLPPMEQWQRLFGWIRQGWRENGPDRRDDGRHRREEVSQQELEAFFVEEVDAATKERLLAMPRDRTQQQLRRMYYGDLSSRDWSDGGQDRPRRRGDGPPPRFLGERGGFRGGGPPPDRGPPDGQRRFPPEGPPGPPPPPPED